MEILDDNNSSSVKFGHHLTIKPQHCSSHKSKKILWFARLVVRSISTSGVFS